MTTEASSRSPEPQEVLRVAIEYFLRDVAVALPGQIEEFDPERQEATVKPLVQRLLATEEGDEVVPIFELLIAALEPCKGVPVGLADVEGVEVVLDGLLRVHEDVLVDLGELNIDGRDLVPI